MLLQSLSPLTTPFHLWACTRFTYFSSIVNGNWEMVFLKLWKCSHTLCESMLSFQLCWLNHSVNKLWACSLISFQHMSFWCPFLDSHPTIHHSNIGASWRLVIELRTSTLMMGLNMVSDPNHHHIQSSTSPTTKRGNLGISYRWIGLFSQITSSKSKL